MLILIRAGNSPFQVSDSALANRIGHGNSGNLLFAHSVYRSLYKPDNQLEVDRYKPDFASPDEMNEKYDALVLPLANAFRPQFEDHLQRYTALIRRLKIPCVVVGVGGQAGLDLAELRGAPIDSSVRAFVSAVLDRSATIGVRGEFTLEYLNRLGFDAVDLIGCPSLFLKGANRHVRKFKDRLEIGDAIAVNHTPDVGPEIGQFVRRVLQMYPNSVLVAQQVVSELSGGDSPRNRVRHFTDIPPWLAFMKSRVFSFGTRIHGNIAALLAGVPGFVIAHDLRTLELARYHKIPHALAGGIGEPPRPADLYEMTDLGPFNAAVAGHFDRYKDFLRKNGLNHAYDDPRNAAAFDARVAATTFTGQLTG